MDWIQTILVIVSAIGALLFLVRKFIFKKKNSKNNDCDEDCGCH